MITIAALLLASALRVGPERAVSESVRDAQPYPAYIVAFAEGDEAALAVWQEATALRAARIDRDGRSLDDPPLLLTNSTEPPEASVARGAEGWLSPAGRIRPPASRPTARPQPCPREASTLVARGFDPHP